MISSSDQEMTNNRSLSVPKFRKIPLRLVLILPFVVLITGAVGLVGYFSYRSGQEAVENLANRLMDQASNRVVDRLDVSIISQQRIVTTNREFVQQGNFKINDPILRNHFWQQANLSSFGISGFGNEQGELIYYGRLYSQEMVDKVDKITSEKVKIGTIFLGETIISQPNQRNHYLVDDQGRAKQLIFKSTVDSRTTDWYLAAQNAQKQIWSPIYVYRVLPELGISAVAPVYDANKQLQGVVSSTISLSEISIFLNKLNFSPSGQVFIMERSGDLVAISTKEAPYLQQKKKGLTRLSTTQSQNPQTRAIATYLHKTYGTLNKINDDQNFHVVVDGVRIFAQVKPYQDDYGLDWLLVTAIPESDFMGEIEANTRWTFFLCGMTLFTALAVGVGTARWITKPIDYLSRSSQAIAQRDWQGSTPLDIITEDQTIKNHPILEIETLADSFYQMLGQLQDSHRKISDNLYQQELENQVVLSVIPDLMFTHNSEGLFLKQLKTDFREDVNILAIDVINKPIQDFLPIELAQLRLHYIHQALQTGRIQTYEQQIEVRGRLQDEEVRIIKISDQEVLVMIRNISDRKQVERELTKAKEAAEAANLAKSTFLANMSHELRTPLNAIMGFSQVMQNTSNLPAEQYEHAEIIYRSGNYLLSLINNILDLSKIEADKITLNMQEFSLQKLLFELEEMMELRAKNSGLSLIIESSSEIPPYIRADEIKLKQVLINLLANAIKFTRQGEVILRVNYSSSSSLLSSSNPILHFSVQDTGVGIAPEELTKIFEPFNQAEAGRETQEGTGLGLTISRKFVQVMGGEMTVTSKLGKGTTFQFQIPVEKAEGVVPPQATNYPRILGLAPGQAEYKILVVDDIEINRQLLVKILSPLGFQVQEAKNGQEAIELWASWQPQLIWMDLRMPIMDGYTATKQIRAYPQGKNTIIIALTANIQQDDRATVLATGCDDFYTKPFHEQTIFDALRQYLGVSYLYAEESGSNLGKERFLTTEDFTSMSPEWQQKLYDACLIGNFDLVMQLIREIPTTAASLAQSLTMLADQFQSETIMKLIQPLL